ncbi:TATA box-binding protein-associated factor RNA polymerase I subunit B [Wyeomyia smithii]|uniref:TATA box-binding protein-associated factor RNA polymerase I subunit B n=1 Tax=Wyeomyia smithii TaxID=174621 RepID=UPI002467DA12|nr:TATA box-binding protein-associated factor RNA polymerase I subunit B [Wyeomyia smithii]
MVEKCEVCGQTEFTVEAGFYYCVECGTKSQQHGQELVDDGMDNLPSMGAAAIKVKSDKKIKRITSWEQANYILLGYAERLVVLGAGDNFKLSLLQLWTAYLRRMEVAFFSKDKPERPRLHVFHRKIDADIIYNRKGVRRKSCSSSRNKTPASSETRSEVAGSSSAVSRRSSVRKARSDQRQLMNAEYESYITSQRSDVNISLHELSVQSLNSTRTGEANAPTERTTPRMIQYSRSSRILMKRKLKMSTGHINRHERDIEEELNCHQLQKGVRKSKPNSSGTRVHTFEHKSPENLNGTLLSALLCLGLNVSKSDLQVADLVRYYREDHLPHANLLQYLPEKIDPSCYSEVLPNFQVASISHEKMRISIAKLTNFLHVESITPDLLKLCKRYLEELCLPMDLLTYIERLMAVFPPQIKFDGGFKFPNYEGRCMAFIIFILKLLFGLNDCTEIKMSKSAAKLNRKMSAVGLFDTSVFVFTEWLQYLEMRKVILSQVNHAINRSLAKDEAADPDVDLFIDYQTRKKHAEEPLQLLSCSFDKQHMSKLKETVQHIVDTHHRQGLSRDSRTNIEFEPSLTPYKSYLEQFLLAYNKSGKIHVPDYMQNDHSNRILSAFVDPADLRYLLLTNHQIRLVTKKVPPSLKLFEFVKSCTVTDFVSNQARRGPQFMCAEYCAETDWNPPETFARPGQPEAATHEAILDNILIRNETERQRTDMIVACRRKNQELSGNDEPDESSILNDSCRSLFSQQSSDIAPNQAAEAIASGGGECVTLLTPNYDYWVRFYGNGEAYSGDLYDERIASGLPDNFCLVVEECARIIENRSHQLYRELMTLETYFFHAVQPVERFFPAAAGDSPPEVLFDETRPLNLDLKRVLYAKQRY